MSYYGPPRKRSMRFKLAMAGVMLLFVAEMGVLFLQSIDVIPSRQPASTACTTSAD